MHLVDVWGKHHVTLIWIDFDKHSLRNMHTETNSLSQFIWGLAVPRISGGHALFCQLHDVANWCKHCSGWSITWWDTDRLSASSPNSFVRIFKLHWIIRISTVKTSDIPHSSGLFPLKIVPKQWQCSFWHMLRPSRTGNRAGKRVPKLVSTVKPMQFTVFQTQSPIVLGTKCAGIGKSRNTQAWRWHPHATLRPIFPNYLSSFIFYFLY